MDNEKEGENFPQGSKQEFQHGGVDIYVVSCKFVELYLFISTQLHRISLSRCLPIRLRNKVLEGFLSIGITF